MHRTLCLLVAAALLLCASGCSSVLMEGAKTTVEKRNTSDFFTDTRIGTSLFKSFVEIKKFP